MKIKKTFTLKQPKKIKVTDQDYLEWLRSLPSAYSNRKPCIAAHFRTAENSGIGIKPLFSAIPLTKQEHDIQHRIGTFKFASRSWWVFMVARHQLNYLMQGGKIPKKYIIKP